ncbi:MAG TPA: hypothetical protein ENN25_02125 [Euryarchaeota archaeon]|nr:hypothetical protein [Euryarchaeota archaeon]
MQDDIYYSKSVNRMFTYLSIAVNNGLLTLNQKDFLSRAYLFVSCIDFGKREVFSHLVADLAAQIDRRNFEHDLQLLRKYLSTIESSSDILKEMDSIFKLQ